MNNKTLLNLLVMLVSGLVAIGSPPSKAEPLQAEIVTTEWRTFTEPSFGYQIDYPSDWHVALTADNTVRANAYGEDVVLRSIGFFGPHSQIVFVDVRQNRSGLSLEQWIEKYPLPVAAGDEHRLLTARSSLAGNIAEEATLPPLEPGVGTPWHHTTQMMHDDLVFNVEFVTLTADTAVYEAMLASFRLIEPTQSRTAPSPARDIMPPVEYGVDVATCCGISDTEYNPFPCNSAQGMGNCTWWARYARRGNNEANLYNCTGNANTWDECAAQYYPHLLSDTPLQSSVIVWMGAGDNHVAYIESMISATQYRVSQMGWTQVCPQSYYNQTHNSSRYEYIRHPDNQGGCCGCAAGAAAANAAPLGGALIGPPTPAVAAAPFDLAAPGDRSTPELAPPAPEPPAALPDTTAPTLAVIANDAPWAADAAPPTFTWPAAVDEGSGVAGYRVYWGPDENGEAEALVSEPAYTPTPPNTSGGAAVTYLRVAPLDNAGNVGEWRTAGVWRYDAVAPAGAARIYGGPIVPTLPVTLRLEAMDDHSGVAAMRFSADGQTWSDWEPYAAARPWQLADVAGPQTVYAQFRDAAGNLSAPVAATVTADLTLAPPASANYRIVRSVMGMGGGAKSSAGYRLLGTSGQPYQTAALQSSTYRLRPGYWGAPGGTTVVNNPPNPPANPTPAHNATNVAVGAALAWTGSDPDGDPLTYEVRFGTANPPLQVVASQSATTYDPPGDLANNTTYYWQIIAKDNRGGVTPGSVWSFTTAAIPTFPDVFYTSPATSAKIGGIPATPADILRYTRSANAWTMVYDGSDHLTSKNLAAFALLDDGSLLLVFGVNQVVPINGVKVTATPRDVIQFTPTTPNVYPLGPGVFSWYFQGKPNGLTTSGENIDALDLAGDRLLLSTAGAATVTAGGAILKAADEDVLAFTAGQWEATLVIDGSLIPGMGAEDINGLWDDPPSGDFYVTILGAFNLGGVKGTGKSVVKLTPNGGATKFTPSLVNWLAPGATYPSTLDGLELAR